jgi:hypothetical protein
VAVAAAADWERPADSAATDLCEASTSYSGTRTSYGRGGASDTGIALAAAEAYNADREDMQNAMEKFLPEGDKKRLLGVS